MNTVAKNIKRLRTQNNMTQEDLAERMNVTRQTVSNWENEKNQPDIETLEALSAVFETDLYDLIYGTRRDNYLKYQKKYVKDLIISFSLIVLFIVLRLTFLPYLYDLDARTYRYTIEKGVSDFLLMALIYFIIGFCILSVFSLWFDCSVRKSELYWILTIICAFPMILIVCEYLSYRFIYPETKMYILYGTAVYPLKPLVTQFLPACSGIAASIHRNRKR